MFSSPVNSAAVIISFPDLSSLPILSPLQIPEQMVIYDRFLYVALPKHFTDPIY